MSSEPIRPPDSLPLFTNPNPSPPGTEERPGRVRSGFRLLPGGTGQPTQPTSPAPDLPKSLTAKVPEAGLGNSAGMRHAPVDWTVVAGFRAKVSEALTQRLGGQRMDRPAQEQFGRAIIVDLLEGAAADAVAEGRPTWTMSEQHALAEAIFDAVFRLGRLQPLVDDERVENIIITGHDTVFLELSDGRIVPGPPVADSQEELIEFLVFLASRSEVNARPFSEAQPSLDLRLDGGSRLAATAWTTARPSVVIRRHGLREVTLADLVARRSLSPVAASFLAAAVRARMSIVVAGCQGAGKTTMVRALCAEIGPFEAIGTFETEYELHLHELRDRHRIVHAWEARPGSGERGPDGRSAGEYSMDAQLYDSFRYNLSRQIVGEIRGREVWPMIKAMESGSGSISTTHAASARAALRKLVTCAMEAGPHVTHDLASSKLAETIDLVVHLHLATTELPDGTCRRRRWVSEILAVSPGERDNVYALTQVFAPAEAGSAVAAVLPDDMRVLERYGFDAAGFFAEAAQHGGRP